MDTECFQLRRHSCRLEKTYRRSESAEDRLAWVQHEHKRHAIYRQKEYAYWNLRLSSNASSARKLWSTLSSLMASKKSGQPSKPSLTAQQLLDFFNAKVEAVGQSTGNCPVQTTLGPAPATFDQFEQCSADDIQRVISVSQSKTCEPDPLPTDVLKQCLPELLPYITDMCNASLQEGCLPMSQRHAIVTPRLKKSGFDASDAKHYRPVSNLTFMS